MQSFKDFIESTGIGGLPSTGGNVEPSWEISQSKPWKAKRADIIDFWKRIRPNIPLSVEPISIYHHGSRFQKDGIRITGSPEFINSVLSRIKDFINYDIYDANTKLDIEYRQIDKSEGSISKSLTPSFVCYIHVLQRSHKIKPKKIEI